MTRRQHSSALLGLEDADSLIPGLLKLNLAADEERARDQRTTKVDDTDLSPPKGTPEFVPKPGFVIKTVLEKLANGGDLQARNEKGIPLAEFYVNVCYDYRVRPPHTRDGKPTKELETALIPVSIGQRREDLKASDKSIKKRVIVDVVVHTDVMVKAKDDAQFKRFVGVLCLDQLIGLERMMEAYNREFEAPSVEQQKAIHTTMSGVHGASVAALRFRESALELPKISYKAGKNPLSHVLQADADPKLVNAQRVEKHEGSVEKKDVAQLHPEPLILPHVSAAENGEFLLRERKTVRLN
ncbi:Vesicle transport protein [Perkinsus chesapeaki]|uniref:Vesicle transport protein n=1 Tax=Perkinsus chesapeaki TaxID=330153 RepID=A0A7J6LN44_PERCH|nr:Vesicle transport protein [Perkinsus chesapeaki]